MKCFMLLTVLVFASKNENGLENVANLGKKIMENAVENSIVVKIEEDEYDKKKSKSSNYFGVTYNERTRKWLAQRWSKAKKKSFFNGYHRDDETAAHASDTLARKLMVNDEKNHKLNFPDDNTEVYLKKTKSSKYFGVFYSAGDKRWVATRWNSGENKKFFNGTYKDEETAAHASDTLARKLMANGEQGHKLNFLDDNTEVHKKTKSSKYFGVTYIEKRKTWIAQRWSKTDKNLFKNGYHKDEETAAHASDTLARKLMANGEQNAKLNFPDYNTEVHAKKYQTNKRKRSSDFDSLTDRNDLEKFEEKEK